MRRVVLLALTASAFAALGTAPAAAVGTRYPFCLQGDEYPGLSYCTFTSYEQCQLTASGRLLQCIANPYYQGPGYNVPSRTPRAGQDFPPEGSLFGLFRDR